MVWISLADSFCQHCHYSSLQSTVEWGGGWGFGWKGFLWHKYPFSYVAKEKIDPHNPLGVFPQPVWGRSHIMKSRIGGDLSEWLQYYIGVFRKMITGYHESWEYYVHRQGVPKKLKTKWCSSPKILTKIECSLATFSHGYDLQKKNWDGLPNICLRFPVARCAGCRLRRWTVPPAPSPPPPCIRIGGWGTISFLTLSFISLNRNSICHTRMIN